MTMNKQLNRRACRNTLPLRTLKMVLTEARMDTPPRNLHPRRDASEALALTLIERMKTGYDKPLPPVVWRNGMNRSALGIKEMAGSDD
jgi:hypothetical protein